MRRFILRINNFIYNCLAKPILFRIAPDKTHSDMITFTSAVGKSSFIRGFVRLVYKGYVDERLVQNFHGIEFESPVGLSAGLDKNGEIVPIISNLGFGFGEVGSVTAKPCVGNPRPWFYRLPKSQSLVVNAGLANEGSTAVIKRLREYSADAIGDFPIILSVAKTNCLQVVSIAQGIDDYVTTVKRAKGVSRIKIVELNISCPNTFGGEPFTTPDKLERLLKAVSRVGIRQPIYIKMPVDLDWADFKKLLDIAINYKIAGVTIANLYKDRKKLELKDELPDTVHGNLSGKPTWDKSNELIRQTYLAYGNKLNIIGVGGIFSAQDAYTKIRLGASLVEVVTGMIFNGPQIAAEINYGLIKLLEADGFESISQAVGIDAK